MKDSLKKALRNNDLVDGSVFLVISVLGVIFSIKSHIGMDMPWKLSPYLFPFVISLLLLALSMSLLLEGRKKAATPHKGETHWRNIILYVAICLLYYFLISFIGFIVTTILFLVAAFLLLGVRKWWLIALLSVLTTLAVYLLFARMLHVMLPKGIIYYYLGF